MVNFWDAPPEAGWAAGAGFVGAARLPPVWANPKVEASITMGNKLFIKNRDAPAWVPVSYVE